MFRVCIRFIWLSSVSLNMSDNSIWVGELSRERPQALIDGFDISDLNFSPEEWYGPNVSLSKLDIFKPLPEQLKGKYDVVHLRFFMTVISDDNMHIVMKNLKEMLSEYEIVQTELFLVVLVVG